MALSELDREIFATVAPADPSLRRVSTIVAFERFRPRMVDAYNAGFGRPAIDPVRMLKILFLGFPYGLSDRQIIERARTDRAFRWFLDFGLHDALPNHTNGTPFRDRLDSARRNGAGQRWGGPVDKA